MLRSILGPVILGNYITGICQGCAGSVRGAWVLLRGSRMDAPKTKTPAILGRRGAGMLSLKPKPRIQTLESSLSLLP